MKRPAHQICRKSRPAIFNFLVLNILFFAGFSNLPAQVTVAEGGKEPWNIAFRNKCKEAHRYRIKSKADFFSFEQATDDITINGNSTKTYRGIFNAAGLKRKVYGGKVVIKCLDCKKAEGCKKEEDTYPLQMTVVSASEIPPQPTPTPIPTPAPIPTPTPLPPPVPAVTPLVETESSTPSPVETPAVTPRNTPESSPTVTPSPAETPAETSPPTLSPAETPSATPTPAPDGEILQSPPPTAKLIENKNLIVAAGFFAVAAVLMLAFAAASAIFAKKLFNNRKYGANTANLGALKKATAIKEELAGKWLKKRKNRNLHAIGVGKIDGSENYCIQLFVENANGEMPDNPPIHLLPEKYRKFPIVIYEMPRAEFLTGENYGNKAKEPHDTIIGGISGANTNLANEYGTIGYFCAPTILRPIRKFRQEVYLLSNSHVFADLSKTKKDDNDLIQQPSPGENKRHNFIASLESYAPLLFDNDTENPNLIDAAIARLFQGKQHRLEIPIIGKINDYTPKDKIELRQKCRKFGRTTGYTEGEIFSIHLSIWIKYASTQQESFFKEQFLIVPNGAHKDFVKGGDSGSLVADYENKAIGLIFAGAGSNTRFVAKDLENALDIENLLSPKTPEIKSYGVANPISEVMKGLNVKLIL